MKAWSWGKPHTEARWMHRAYKNMGGDLQAWRRAIVISPAEENFLLGIALDGIVDDTEHIREAVDFRRKVLRCFDHLVRREVGEQCAA